MSTILTPLPSPHPGIGKQAARPKTWSALPFPQASASAASPITPAPLPAWPSAPPAAKTDFPQSWPSPLTVLPSPSPKAESKPADPKPAAAEPPAKAPQPVAGPQPARVPETSEAPDFTDEDLRVAFGPIVEESVRRAVYAKENGIDTYLEPMLRATIRRALAEYAPAARPFQPPGALDRFVWHIKALFTSRTYEDILFEKTRRFQVDEVFLLDMATLALVSFASCDPARHASVRRVASSVHRLALQVRDAEGNIQSGFALPDHRNVITCKGKFVILAAIVRGMPGEMVTADLDFALRRIEDHFRHLFEDERSDLLYTHSAVSRRLPAHPGPRQRRLRPRET